MRANKARSFCTKCATLDDPLEQERLARELDAHLMGDSPLVAQLKVWDEKPKDSPERLEAFKRAPEILYANHHVVTDENVDEYEARFHAMSEDDPEFKLLGDVLHRYILG